MYKDKGIKAIFLLLIFITALIIGGFAFNKGLSLVFNAGNNVNGIKNEEITRQIYVLGAVQREGCYTVTANMTYRELFYLTGLYTISAIKEYDYDKYINIAESFIVIDYMADNKIKSCINIKTADILDFATVDIPLFIAQKIVDSQSIGYKSKYELLQKGILSNEEFMSIEYKIYCY